MTQAAFIQRLKQYRLIASVKEAKNLEKAASAKLSAVVLSIGNIGVIKGYVDFMKSQGIPVFLHLERMGGISHDREGIAFLAHYVKPDGIVTTRNSLIKLAKKQGLLTIQRLFLVDSDALKSGLQSVQENQPDAVEIMPALLPDYIEEYQRVLDTPIIAGGLLRTREQMLAALRSGAMAVFSRSTIIMEGACAPMKQTLLFDLDGTLLDSREAVIEAVAQTADQLAPGLFSRNELLHRFGESLDDFLFAIAEAAGEIDKDEVSQQYFAFVRKHIHLHSKLFPGVQEGLELLKNAGCQLAVVTNKQREFAVAGLELAGINSFFDAVVAVDDVSRGKPSAEPILRALSIMGKQPEEALMIGDSRYDVVAAWEAGVPSVVLEWYGREEWPYVKPTYRYPDFQAFVAEVLAAQIKGGR